MAECWIGHCIVTDIEVAMLSEFVSELGGNPYFSAGFGLVGVGTGLAILRRALQVGTVVFRRKCMMSLHVTCEDKSYYWLLEWINRSTQGSAQHVSVQTHYEKVDGGQVSTSFALSPSPGDHYIRYGGRWLKVERQRENMVSLAHGTAFESVTLTTFGRDKTFFTSILEEARAMAIRQMETGTVIFTTTGVEWRQFGHPRRKRALSSVVLDQGVAQRIVHDANEFIQRSQWYFDRGIPYRRGYLLYGPPGCGKSSFITALAGALNYSIAMMSLSDRGLSDEKLQHLLNVAPLKSVILLEDVDTAFVSREMPGQHPSAYQGMARITFSGFLNALDGVASSEARILVMTTNHVDRLDRALIRPGRIDVRQYVGYCTDYQLRQLYLRFYPDSTEDAAIRFCQSVRSVPDVKDISAAHVQNYLLSFKDDPEGSLEKCDTFAQYAPS